MALETRGLAEGLQSGFQLGSNFFNTIRQGEIDAEERKFRQYQIDRQAELDALNKQKIDLEMKGLRRADRLAEQQANDKLKVDDLGAAIHGYQTGRVSAEDVLKTVSKYNINLDALLDEDLRNAYSTFTKGQFDPTNQSHVTAANQLFGDKLQDAVGNAGRDGTKITKVDISGVQAMPNNPNALVPILKVRTESGDVYEAPMTENRTALPDDMIKGIPLEALVQKAVGMDGLYKLLDTKEIVEVLQAERERVAQPYNTVEGNFITNPLLGTIEYGKPDPKKNPTVASLAFDAANGETAEIRSAAQNALNKYMAAQGDQESQEARIKQQTEILKSQIDGISKRSDLAAEELAEIQQREQNLMEFERQFNDYIAAGGQTGALQQIKNDLLNIAKTLGFNVDEQYLASADSLEAVNGLLVLAGMQAIKGVASESDRAYVVKSEPGMEKFTEANRRILQVRKSYMLLAKYSKKAIQDAAAFNDPKMSPEARIAKQMELQQLAQNVIDDVPITGVVVDASGDVVPMSLTQFIEAQKRGSEDVDRWNAANSIERNRIMGEWFADWQALTTEGLAEFNKQRSQ